MKQTETNFSLKDQLFNKDKVSYLSGLIFGAYPQLDKNLFIDDIIDKFSELELMDRVHHIVSILEKHLPDDYPGALDILVSALPKELDPDKHDDDFGVFILAPYSYFVAKYGCNSEYLNISLNALEEMTKRFSCEGAIRTFINKFEDETFSKMLTWSKSKNYHVRRLASEGSRPKLPWASKINLDYRKPIDILDNLYTDDRRYITRSVANHLNDIAKIEPKLVTDTLKKWQQSGAQDLDYIISHSTRTLVKLGDNETLKLLGYSPNPQAILKNFKITTNPVTIGSYLEFEFDIICEKPENFIIDYKLYFISKNGKLLPKVFKIKKGVLKGTTHIQKRHLLKLMTTKALYPGEHFVEVVVNGKSFVKGGFILSLK